MAKIKLTAENRQQMEGKNKGGRPMIHEEKSDQRLSIYVTKSQLEAFEELAYTNRVTVSKQLKDMFETEIIDY